jgi:hypothetical protein
MNAISTVYRVACREIALPAAEKALFMRLLREISVNAIRSRKAWQLKDDFISLWFISAGRFPELAAEPYGGLIAGWVAAKLPFDLSKEEINALWH